MAFQAKRLRVQLPCGERTAFEEAVGVLTDCPLDSVCFGGSYPCDPNTCVIGRASEIGPRTLCQAPTDVCFAASGQRVDPASVLIDPEHLPVLREHLEARLRDVAAAEKALEERGGQ
jgi:hypothetical protein